MIGLVQRLQMSQVQSPQQILLSSLLQLPTIALEQRIKLELEQNPLLEEVMEDELLEDQEMSQELDAAKGEDSKAEEQTADIDKEPEVTEGEDEVDWELILGSPEEYDTRMPSDNSAEEMDRQDPVRTTLSEHLLNQLHTTNLTPDELYIGEYIIWNIDESGYLSCPIESVAENLEVDVGVAEKVLGVIQRLDPVGIAARNLRECLLVQMLEQDEPDQFAVELIRDHFEDFKNRRFEKLVKKLEVTIEEISEADSEIRKLNPKPGSGFVGMGSEYVVPDITVERVGEKFRILQNDWNIPQLRISNRYRAMLLDKTNNTSSEAKKFIRDRLDAARWLINSIHQRRATIERVMDAIIRRQEGFFSDGAQHIKPMILKDIADDIGMDISTISRVTSGKYVQTEWGTFELKYFFSEKMATHEGDLVSNKTIKNRIREIIEGEDPTKPLNDQRISQMLDKEGFKVARRTVAKYREQMNMPVSRLRRKIR